jgi:hypothetical protein
MTKLVLLERVRSAKTEEKQERLINGLKELLKQAQSGKPQGGLLRYHRERRRHAVVWRTSHARVRGA